jgi:predicted phosphoribosyltransferase
MAWLYADRRQAGRILGAQLARAEVTHGSLVLASTGGLAVAEPIAEALSGELATMVDRPRIRGRIVVLVSDGLSTAEPMIAAVSALRRLGARRIVVVAAVATQQAIDIVAKAADDVLCPAVPEPLGSVGAWFREPDHERPSL